MGCGFSELRTPGSYFVFDPTNRARSFTFRIAEDVYKPVLRDSVRVFYYQRSGTPITEKNGGVWHHSGGHLGRNQDRAAQYSQEARHRAGLATCSAAGSTRAI